MNDLEFEGSLDEDGGTRYVKGYTGQTTGGKNTEDVYPSDKLIDVEELKKSGIEDIKQLKQEAKRKDKTFGLSDLVKGTYIGKIDYIKEKFNITAKDLK